MCRKLGARYTYIKASTGSDTPHWGKLGIKYLTWCMSRLMRSYIIFIACSLSKEVSEILSSDCHTFV
jgi:hypothetical protein